MKKQGVKKKTISLMVINYNGKPLLNEYFTSVFAQTRVPDEVIMFDNLDTDGSAEFVRKKFPSVKIISEDGFNTGTALGNNIAFSHTTGDFIIIQSNDIVLDKNCIKELYENINADPKIGIVSSISIREQNRKAGKMIVDHAGGTLDVYGFALANHALKPVKDIPEKEEVFFAYGDSIMIRREAYEKTKGLDTRMFMMNDDIDFSWRVRQFGYKIIYTKKSVIYHKVSVTIKKNNKRPRIRYLSERNSIRTYLKNTSWPHFFKTLPMYIIILCGQMGYFFYRGKFDLFFSDVRSILWNLFYLPETIYLKFKNQMNSKKNIDKLFVNKSFKLMLFKEFSKSL